MDGSNREVIVRESLIWPNGLCIDYTVSRIYWADAKHHVIESSKFDGMDRKKVRRHSDDLIGKFREEMNMNSMLLLHCKYSSYFPFVNTHARPRKQIEPANRAKMQVTTEGTEENMQSGSSCLANEWERICICSFPTVMPKTKEQSIFKMFPKCFILLTFFLVYLMISIAHLM
jgi:hypothetical protein